MPPSSTQRRRILFALLFTLAATAALIVRTSFVMLVRGPDLAKTGISVRIRDVPVQAPRGRILASDGQVLASSYTIYAAYAIPAQVKSPVEYARLLAPILGQPEDRIAKIMGMRQAIVWLSRRLDGKQVTRLNALALTGIGLAPTTKRAYPYGVFGGTTLGFTGIDNQGLEGLEKVYDHYLRGQDGAIGIEMDARNRALPEPRVSYDSPVAGDDVVLTLNLTLQAIAEEEAKAAQLDTGAKMVSVLMMDVQTGGVLAMAQSPAYDPGRFADYPMALRRNTMVTDVIPPGSTFKAITAASALAAGVVKPSDGFYDPGFVRVDGVPLHCWKQGGHGAIQFTDVVAKSCNVGFVEVGLRLGVQRFYAYMRRFHVIGRSGVDLPGDARSIFPLEPDVKPIDLATMSFGQTLALTPMDLISAISAIADGGVWHRPHLLKEIVAPSGKLVASAQTIGQRVVPAAAAATAIQLLEGVVQTGSGKPAKVPGYGIAGKTGTAQAVINGRYVEGKYISSFIGFGPTSAPRVAMLVEIYEPVGPYYGGQIAAPVVGRAMGQALAALGIPPQQPAPMGVPDVTGLLAGNAMKQIKDAGLQVTGLGQGDKVTAQFPPAGAEIQPGSQVVLYFGSGGRVAVPDLRGLTVEQAGRELGTLGLRMQVIGEGTVVDQVPLAGTSVLQGTRVTVRAKPPDSHNE